jgi:hypothetical protein
VEQVRRPRACLASTHSGGAGAPPGTTRGACQELAYYPGPKCPEGCAARRRKKNAVMERREAPALSKRECGKTEDWCAARCSIPSGFSRGDKRLAPAKAGDYGVPGAAKNTGDDACLFVIPGRERQRANPESRETLGASLDSGFRLSAGPGMTDR